MGTLAGAADLPRYAVGCNNDQSSFRYLHFHVGRRARCTAACGDLKETRARIAETQQSWSRSRRTFLTPECHTSAAGLVEPDIRAPQDLPDLPLVGPAGPKIRHGGRGLPGRVAQRIEHQPSKLMTSGSFP